MKCIFDEAWIGKCGKDSPEGICEYHQKKKCWCGEQAVKDCTIAVSFVCGQPLCSDHKCHRVGFGMTGHGNHSDEGRKQFLEF